MSQVGQAVSQRRSSGMKSFFIIWVGQVISIVGSGLTSFALGVWMYERTGKATPFALTVLFANLPGILLAPFAGSLADRWSRRWLMILSDSGDALVTLCAVILVATGRLEVWHVYAIALTSSIFSSFQEPAYQASITMLVPKENLSRANGLVQAAGAAQLLISPLLAGALLGFVGMRGIFAIDFATYFFAVGALFIVAIPQPKRTTEQTETKGGMGRGFSYGWRYLLARPGLFGLLLYFALVNFLLAISSVLTGPLVLSFGSAVTLGAVETVSGVGMMLGSVAISIWGGPRRRIIGVVGAIALASVGVATMGLRPSGPFVAAGMALFLFSIPIASGCSQAIFQAKIAPDVQGRVFATRSMIARSISPIAYLLAGPLADRIFQPLMVPGGLLAAGPVGLAIGTGPGRGIGLLFVLAGLFMMIASAAVWTNPRIRHVETELPDARVEVEEASGCHPDCTGG